MLEITQSAAALLDELRRGQELPDDFGIRVFAEAETAGEMTIALGFTDAPDPRDQVTETDGVKVYVAEELAQPLEDAAIDVTSEDGTPRLVFRPKGGTLDA